MRGLKDRTVLVTGGANGIGAAIARRLAEEGCAVGILDLDAATGRDARRPRSRRTAGAPACTPSTSPTTTRSPARSKAFEASVGPVAFLVNNAGWDRAAKLPRHHAGVLAQDRRHQSVRAAEREPRRAARHGGTRLRPRRQYRVRRRPGRLLRRGGLFRLQGRHHRLHQDGRARARRQGRDPQYALSRPDRHRHSAQLSRRPGRRPHRRGAQARDPDAARSAYRRIIPGSSPSCCRTTPPTSPARPSASRAVSPCTDSGLDLAIHRSYEKTIIKKEQKCDGPARA